jgi:hypothetical protein
MKTKLGIRNWRKVVVVSGILTTSLLFSFCGGAKTGGGKPEPSSMASVQTDGKQDLDTIMDKYCGLYAWGENTSRPGYFSIGKFPENSRIHLTQVKENGKYIGEKYVPIEKNYVGKCFYVEGAGAYDTKRVADFAGGYIAKEQGNIILGVDKAGNIHIQNYDHASKTGLDDNPFFNLGGEGVYGKFIMQADGKYAISVNNVMYLFKKGCN